jgi:hypothetical protein
LGLLDIWAFCHAIIALKRDTLVVDSATVREEVKKKYRNAAIKPNEPWLRVLGYGSTALGKPDEGSALVPLLIGPPALTEGVTLMCCPKARTDDPLTRLQIRQRIGGSAAPAHAP